MRKEIKKYLKGQKEFIEKNSLKVGDTVRILRAAEDDEMGWNNSWMPEMDAFVGGAALVTKLDGEYGIQLQDGMEYPYFVLEKVDFSSVKSRFSVGTILNIRKALKDHAAGNKECTMTDMDFACDMLEEFAKSLK